MQPQAARTFTSPSAVSVLGLTQTNRVAEQTGLRSHVVIAWASGGQVLPQTASRCAAACRNLGFPLPAPQAVSSVDMSQRETSAPAQPAQRVSQLFLRDFARYSGFRNLSEGQAVTYALARGRQASALALCLAQSGSLGRQGLKNARIQAEKDGLPFSEAMEQESADARRLTMSDRASRPRPSAPELDIDSPDMRAAVAKVSRALGLSPAAAQARLALTYGAA